MPSLGSRAALEQRRRRVEAAGQLFVPDPVRDLSSYLSGPFLSGLPLRVTTWQPDATGQQLSDAMVGRLEVVTAMKRLPNHLCAGLAVGAVPLLIVLGVAVAAVAEALKP